MEIAPMIVTRILRDKRVTLSQLEASAIKRNVSLNDLYAALDKVHRNKQIDHTVSKGEVVFKPAPPPKTPTDHLACVREHYPSMTPETDGSGIDIDYSWLFLKTKDERDAFKAEMSGRPVYVRSKYVKK